ncbi:major facilitator superfamily domain-containing protein [Zychaea mexicana]|uniref:major facilitator superfamily domain-containing protein n=1 Tax=Zychaea mexicana TaxID=64656 RepID=UPI0022FEEF83|nr:major facilitator superfamily domain-containing protein [Zychaea mexicana]KAI9498501.1 major facilitator superfamily domain-containing protein [Zychaea mexicana]
MANEVVDDSQRRQSIASVATLTSLPTRSVEVVAAALDGTLSKQSSASKHSNHDAIGTKEKIGSIADNDEEQEEDPIPDGGLSAWLVILGTFFVQFTAFGTASSWGVMQNHFEQHVFNHVPNAQLQLSFAGTLMEACVDSMGVVVQLLANKLGSKTVLVMGAFLMVLGLEMAGFTTEIWHLYLTQGILFGTGASFMFVIAMNASPQWFDKRRGLALGLASSGSGVGGLVLPFILTPLNNSLGVGWAYRILGFVILACAIIACVCIRNRPTSSNSYAKKEPQRKIRELFNFEVLKDLNYVLWVLGSMIGLMGFFVPYFFLPSFANYLGISSTDSSVIVSVMSASNFCGRILIGVVADRIGRLNTDIICLLITGISCLTLWMFANSYEILMAFGVVFGFFCASYFTLLSPITATILGMKRYPTGLSILLLSNVVSVFGPSIASAVESAVDAEPYLTYKVFTGVVYILGGLILSVLKVRMTKSVFANI